MMQHSYRSSKDISVFETPKGTFTRNEIQEKWDATLFEAYYFNPKEKIINIYKEFLTSIGLNTSRFKHLRFKRTPLLDWENQHKISVSFFVENQLKNISQILPNYNKKTYLEHFEELRKDLIKNSVLTNFASILSENTKARKTVKDSSIDNLDRYIGKLKL